MELSYDSAKRAATLAERGLDFADAIQLFAGVHATLPDDRMNYGERRYISAGYIADRLVVLVWTPRGSTRRIISMRYAHAKEEQLWARHLGRGR